MALAASTSAVRRTLRDKELVLTLTPTGNYVTGGDTVNLTVIANPAFKGDAAIGYPGDITQFEVIGTPAGYSAKLIKGGTLATWKLMVFQGGAAVSTPSAQLAAAAYPAGVLADVFTIRLIGPHGRM